METMLSEPRPADEAFAARGRGGESGNAAPGKDPRRALILGAHLRGSVDLDGPALRVRPAGRAESRYPLARLSRVVSSADVRWSAAALGGCLQYGIPIVMLDKSGAPLGVVYPARPRVSRIAEDLDELLERPDWHSIYANWLRAERMRLFRDWQKSMREGDAGLARRKYADLFRSGVYRMDEKPLFSDASSVWLAWLCALVSGAIRGAGLQPVHWGSGGQPLDLLQDLTRLLELRLRLEVREDIEEALKGEDTLARVFHAMSQPLEEQCARTVGSLARRVRQVLAEWR